MRLWVRVYLWFLLGLALTLGSAAALIVVLNGQDGQQRAREMGMVHTRMVRDFTEHLLHEGKTPSEIASLMRPALAAYHASAAVFDESGAIVAELHGNNPDIEPPHPSPEQLDTVKKTGELTVFRGRLPTFGLPLTLHDGTSAVLIASMHSRGLQRLGGPVTRALVGLGVILVVGLLLSWPLVRSIVQPLEGLARVTERFGAGDLDARISTTRHDEIGQLATLFNQMAERISALVLEKKRLLGDMSHELKTPVARIKLATELARGGATDEAKGYLDRIDRQCEVIAGLVDELLLYARLDLQGAVDKQRLSVRTLIDEVAHQLAIDAETKKVQVTIEASGEINVERKLFVRTLGNVLQNAIKHSPTGATVRVFSDGRRVVIEDAGPGVAETELTNIFRPFYRTDAARTRDTGGTGLGLAIVERSMAAHGGRATAERGERGGLRVTLMFPDGVPREA